MTTRHTPAPATGSILHADPARQAFLRDYYVVFTSDCTATYSQPEHDATLRNIDAFFGQVVSAEEIRACWEPEPVRLRALT